MPLSMLVLGSTATSVDADNFVAENMIFDLKIPRSKMEQ
jgi:hypothetical protein